MSSKLLFPAATAKRFVSNSTTSSSSRIPPSVAWNYDNLRLAEVLCPVCQSVLVEPVFLPCEHLFCRDCLSGTIEKNSLCCPCCRKRFGTWYRHASLRNTLVHERLWEAIQSQFRDLLEDESSPRATKASTTSHATTTFPKLNSPGSLRKEYNEELKRYQKELLEETQKEVIASEQYIINLYKQEGVIDLADSSSHVSVSSATTPDLQDNATKVCGGNTSSLAGPSTASDQLAPKVAAYGGTMAAADSRSDKIVAIHGSSRASPTNGSVISISSTSSAVSAVTSTSCVSSSISERFSIIKSVTQTLGRSAELVKQKATDLTQRLSFGKQKPSTTTTTNAIDLNKSELCMKPTELHKTEQRGAVDEDDDGEADETDSLKAEQNHFVPIHASLPKSSFSLATVVRVPPKRTPQACTKYTMSPRKCSMRPLLSPTPGGRSAFSVVNFCLLTPPKNPFTPGGATVAEQEEPSSHSSSVSGSREKKTNGTAVQARGGGGGGGRRRRKLKFTPTKARKSSSTVARAGGNIGSSEAVPGTTTRTTRRSADNKTTATLLKDIIVSDQQRLEQQIEMERRDFEFAQKLQQKLNRPHGVMQEIHRPYPPVARNCSYSLRRKGSDNVSETSTGASTKRQSEADEPEDAKSVAQRTRKRKATSSSVENDVPTVSPPSEGTNTRKRQTRRTIKAEPVESVSPITSAVAPVQRKSSRNKAR
ncbi:uncharacterized protein LOC118457757 [Anopheles albimanus]|uniref:RING-type E3 ubiquitin transferase n=1 Tax=Anopheles albimanus TaxID=7167 RepID=A0A182FRM0_ANOAL|nr:uncharacterized protein LOC118457757 [Anopheles albimanus]